MGQRIKLSGIVIGLVLISSIMVFAALPLNADEPQISGKAPRSKLIMAGPDGPTIDYLIENVELVEKMVPHDGIALQVDAQGIRDGKAAIANRHNIFRNWKWDKKWFAPKLKALKAVKFKKLTDNFIYTATTNADFDMFDNAAWENVCHNFKLMAWFARKAGFKGIFFDVEHYNYGKPILYQYVPNDKHSFEETYLKARQRGREFMQAITAEYPQITILTVLGSLSINFPALESANPMEYLKTAQYGLSTAFFNGMYDVMPKGVQLLDGCEIAGYSAGKEMDFLRMTDDFTRKSPQLLAPANLDKFLRQSSLAIGLYLDSYLNNEGFYVIKSPEMSRLDLFRRNLMLAMRHSKRYAWLYGEQCRWFPIKLPAVVEKAMLRKPGKGRLWEEAFPGVTAAIEFAKAPDATALKMLKAGKLDKVYSNNFDDQSTNGTTTTLADCKINKELKGINTWQSGSSKGTFELDQNNGYQSRCCAKMTSVKFGSILSGVAVKPGQIYFVRAAAKTEGDAQAKFTITWQNSERKWVKHLDNISMAFTEPLSNDWHGASSVVLIPDKVSFMYVACGVSSATGNSVCRIDNFEIYSLLLLPGLNSAEGADFKKEISEVKSGVRTEARAVWWGFNPEDATESLQDAINSGAKKIVVDNPGKPWIVGPLQLAGNQEIVFAEDVQVIAKKGLFEIKTECLFTARDKKNIVLTGRGNVIFKMHKLDYDDKEKYARGEWRHLLSLLNVKNVVVSGFTFDGSGGDGVYVNRAEDVTLENLKIINQYRQGISVICAENLMIRRCLIRDTGGTAPQAGIDFEPNKPDEYLVNCVVEDCKIIGNAGDGIQFWLPHLKAAKSRPISITVRRCDISGNNAGVTLMTTRSVEFPAKGDFKFIDCTISDSTVTSFRIGDAIKGLHKILFKNCKINNSNTKSKTAIEMTAEYPVGRPSGDITFKNVTVTDKRHDAAVFTFESLWSYLASAKGTAKINGRSFDFKALLKEERKKADDIVVLATDKEFEKLRPATGQPSVPQKGLFGLRFQNLFLLWAREGEDITLSLQNQQLVSYVSDAEITVYNPDEKVLKTIKLPIGAEENYIFKADKTGLFRVRIDSITSVIVKSSHNGQGLSCHETLRMIRPKGKLYFQVPSGVKKIGVIIKGDGNEWVSAALIDPFGKIVMKKEKVLNASLSTVRADSSSSEIWAIDFIDSVEDVSLNFRAPLIPVISQSPSLLLRKAAPQGLFLLSSERGEESCHGRRR